MKSPEIPFSPGDLVVGYMRDSGGDEQEMSTQQQETQLRTWCESNDLVLTRIFVDSARQGSSTEKREQFLAMIDHFHEHGCPDKGVIVWSMSRFARNELDANYYKSDLRRRHFVVWSITENFPDTPEGRLIEHAFNFADEKALEKSSHDIKRGLGDNFERFGAIPGTPPFGFKITQKVVGIRRDNTPHTVNIWVIDPDQSPIIKAAYQMRADGYSVADIHAKYHVYKNRTCYSTFFRNRLYIGEMCYGGITKENYVEPILSRDLWDKVQAINEVNRKVNSPTSHGENAQNPRRSGGNFALSGIAFCARCGSILNGQVVQFKGQKSFNYYICTGHSHGMKCDAPRIPQKALEDSILESMTDYIQDPNMLTMRETDYQKSNDAAVEEFKARIKILQKTITENKRRLNNLSNRIANDSNAPDTILGLIKSTEKDIQTAQDEIDRIESRLNRPNVCARTPAEVKDLADKLMKIVTSDDPTEKRTIIKLLINRIEAERVDNAVRGMVYYYDDAVPREEPPDPKVLMPT